MPKKATERTDFKEVLHNRCAARWRRDRQRAVQSLYTDKFVDEFNQFELKGVIDKAKTF